MNKRYLFFDIDGVLNDHSKLEGSPYCGINPKCMDRLNFVIEKTNCKLILTSAWRYMINNHAMTLTGFEYMLYTPWAYTEK